MTDIQERVKKLPQWAQRYIGKLHRDIESLKGELGEIASPDAKITWCRGLLFDDRKYGLPDRAEVEFATPTGRITVMLREGIVRVRASNTLSIVPEASNEVKVLCKDRWHRAFLSQAESASKREEEG